MDPQVDMEGDVVVCSDHADAKKLVMELADKIRSLRGIDGGALANAKYVEQINADAGEHQPHLQDARQHQDNRGVA